MAGKGRGVHCAKRSLKIGEFHTTLRRSGEKFERGSAMSVMVKAGNDKEKRGVGRSTKKSPRGRGQITEK